ncbi:UNVERIFIED_CONTAM: ammonium transporter [Trichonephila clavipes]
MYSSPEGGIFPSLGFLIGDENTAEAVLAGGDDAPYYSARSDFFFQVVFAATCMSIVSGAVAERMKLWAFLAFAVVMTGFIYPVQGFWKWGSGFLNEAGFLDFAGSGVVHMAGAAAALAGVLLLGARKGKYGANGQVNAIPGCNLPLATLGTFILWMGWFGFNGGSQLKMSTIEDANAVAQVFTNTNMAAAGDLAVVLHAQLDHAALGLDANDLLGGQALVQHEAGEAARTVAALLHLGAVGVEDAVAEIDVRMARRLDDQQLVETDAGVAIAPLLGMLGLHVGVLADQVEDHEVIAQTVHLGKAQ